MDDKGFDNLARSLATSRRGLLKYLVAGLLGWLGGLLGAGGIEAQTCKGLNRKCTADSECCSGLCDPVTGRCACSPGAEQCGRDCIDPASYQSDPDNCGSCRNRCRSTAHGSAICSGGVCGIACDSGYDLCGDRCCRADRPCCNGICCPQGQCCNEEGRCSAEACAPHCTINGEDYAAGTINPAHDCQVCDPNRSTTSWSLVDDFTTCGGVPGRVCCNGECCSPTECCNPTGFCEECGPHCRIDGVDYDDGAVNPANPCQVCKPDQDPLGWSNADDATVCGGDLDDELVCCSGVCCGLDQCCRDGVCAPCGCEIDGRTFERGDVNPSNTCHVCNPDTNRNGWSPQPPNSPCGLTDGRFCCDGVCCPQGECCNDIGECEECGCVINGQNVAAGAVNPANTCQVCNPDRDRSTWTTLDNGDACGSDDDDRVCCGGTCCPQGECCVGGSCQACGCEIDGVTYEPDTINPANSCQVCRPSNARLAWSPIDNGTTCGADGKCCGGECCPNDECCILDACGTCLCSIDGVNYAAGKRNPANACQVCNPNIDPFAWSPISGESCGIGQVCCNGVCRSTGECCGPDFGAGEMCTACECTIDGVGYSRYAFNPANPCQICNPDIDPSSWSPLSGSDCGNDQICCNGACCGEGECCGPNFTCAACECTIDGISYARYTINPATGCQICNPDIDPFAWSPLSGSDCENDQVCCNGVCCPEGACCGPDLTCEACACTIDGIDYAREIVNPSNECEQCIPEIDPNAWSPLFGFPCGAEGDQVCCSGVCCAKGECCDPQGDGCYACCTIDEVSYPRETINPANECEVCLPEIDHNAWSPQFGFPCGEEGNRVCCDGICCRVGECCDAQGGGCYFCGCTIDGVNYAPEAINPANECQQCLPEIDPSTWSPLFGFPCGDGQVCCDGHCCAQGECCDPQNGGCYSCGCAIDGVTYVVGARNPNNSCEVCDPSQSATSWSVARDHAKCGDDLNQVCCNGVCCPDGTCCRSSFGTCNIEWCGLTDPCDYEDPCGCTIDGVFYPHQAINPANTCQWCDAYFSTTAWYSRGDFAGCGPNDDQYCCNDVCCELGACCNDAGVCDIDSPYCRGCVIGDRFYRHLQRNPDNACQLCNADISETSWSNAENHRICGQMIDEDGIYWGDLLCCEGVCCTEWYSCCRADGTCGQGPCPAW